MVAAPPPDTSPDLQLPSEAATDALGRRLAAALRPGDVVALWGDLGAGKTALARAVIRARLGRPDEEVPSPSFALVQVYDDPRGDLWHVDLYRLKDEADAAELGLDEAPILLIEWPGRLGGRLPAPRLDIRLDLAGDGRRARLAASGTFLAGRERLFEELAAAAAGEAGHD